MSFTTAKHRATMHPHSKQTNWQQNNRKDSLISILLISIIILLAII